MIAGTIRPRVEKIRGDLRLAAAGADPEAAYRDLRALVQELGLEATS